ncbi:Nucleoside-diphosphate-sugar epimerase [Lachnospiraceae bacterium]|nr:Nucleoside-diphosphate-sugar epimerase [Lachnospiraceae bacterium]
MEKVVITGANGFLGSNLVKSMLDDGYFVYAVINSNNDNLVDIKSENLIITDDIDSVKGAVDIFFHFAWVGNSGLARADVSLQQKNIIYSCNMLNVANKLKCKKFFFAGSVMEYEAFTSISIDSLKPGLGNIYSASKLTADIYLKTLSTQLGINYISFLISNIYGPGEKNQRLIYSSINKIIKGEKTAFTDGKQKYDFIYIKDAINKFVIIAKYGTEGSYYIGNPTQKQLRDYIVEMGSVLGIDENNMGIGDLGESTQIIDYDMIDTDRFEREFEYRNTVGFKDGIRNTVNYIKGC